MNMTRPTNPPLIENCIHFEAIFSNLFTYPLSGRHKCILPLYGLIWSFHRNQILEVSLKNI